MRFASLVLWTGGALALTLTGCPDPEGQFTEFEERQKAISGDGGGGTGGGGTCTAPTEGEADGVYLFALSATINEFKAFALDATLTTSGSDPLLVDMTLQPLAKEDQTTPVGDPISFTGLEVNADGTFEWDLGAITLINAANPISAFDVESTLILSGVFCGGEEGIAFVCGDVNGIVTAPLNMFDLVGSTFTMQRYEGEKPAPVINCAKDPANYE